MLKKLLRTRQFNIRFKIIVDALSNAESHRAQNLLDNELQELKRSYYG